MTSQSNTSTGHLNIDSLMENIVRDTQAMMIRKQIEDPFIVGIHTGGVWLAKRLNEALQAEAEMGELDISFYRDDFGQTGLHANVKASHLPGGTEGRDILLVDDVIMSGRTIRAALAELFDLGRPASISLITLIDLGRRELPIQPDVVGGSLALGHGQSVKLLGPENLQLEIHQSR